MSKILLITSYFHPKPDANGVCIGEVAQELQNKGYEVFVICFRRNDENDYDNIKGVHIYRIRQNLHRKLKDYSDNTARDSLKKPLKHTYMAINRIKLLLYLPFYPLTSISSTINFSILSLKLYKKEKFDIVVSTYKPLEATIASVLLKNKFKNIKLVMYILDSFVNSGGGRFISREFAEKRGWRWEKKAYVLADKIINMKCHENYYKNSKHKYEIFNHKMVFLDFPLIKEPLVFSEKSQKKENRGSYKLVYTGSLDLNIRNPEFTCKVFEQLDSLDYNLEFYSSGNCENIIKKYHKLSNSKIIGKGFVKHEESLKAINNSDILVSIGNLNTDMVPSKIFEYMSTGKPIIHFYSSESDSCLSYLRQYPLSLCVESNPEIIMSTIKQVERFIVENSNKNITDFEKIRKLFPLNVAISTANCIDSVINREGSADLVGKL